MSFIPWLRSLRSCSNPVAARKRMPRHPRGPRARLILESLEDRTVPSAVLPGFNATTFPANDDSSVGPVNIGFNVNFFGPTYSQLYVNNNGNVTFGGPDGTYTPFGLTSPGQTPRIAPFFGDVWTFGNSGDVTYGTGNVNGHAAFGVNWPHVNYFSDNNGTKQNTFQVVLIDRSDIATGDFDIDLITTRSSGKPGSASGGVNGLGGQSAHAGFTNGSGVAGSFF